MVSSTIFCGFFGAGIQNRGEATVKRWHNLGTLQKETLACHTYDVIKNSWVIGRVLYLLGHEINIQSLLEQAMFHDIEEIETGDISHTFKKDFELETSGRAEAAVEKSAVKAIKNHFPDAAFGELIQERWITYRRKDTLEAQVVDLADQLSAVNFLEHEVAGLGNRLLREDFLRSVGETVALRDRYSWLAEVWPLIFGQSPEELKSKIEQVKVQ